MVGKVPINLVCLDVLCYLQSLANSSLTWWALSCMCLTRSPTPPARRPGPPVPYNLGHNYSHDDSYYY